MIKKVMKDWYVHNSNEKELLDEISRTFSKLEKERVHRVIHDYSSFLECNSYVIKYNSKDNSISLIETPNWDIANEPDVGNGIKISLDMNVKILKAKGQIYHSKENFVNSDYTGFDINKAKQRTKLWNTIPNLNKNKIGWKSYWISLLKENNIEL